MIFIVVINTALNRHINNRTKPQEENMENNNPLAKYFRQPGLSCRIPSRGRFQDETNVRFTATGEVNVLPMRAADELLLKSPDALMSGMAIEKVISSCVPDVKDVMQLPSQDVDALLLAIRSATYGPIMHVNSTCPECETENDFDFDLSHILDTIVELEDEYIVRLTDEIVVYMRPFNFRNSTQASLIAYQEARKVQLADNEHTSDEEKQRQLNSSYERINNMNIQMVADCVERVVTPEGEVTDRKFISDFVHNIEQKWVGQLEEKLKSINGTGVIKKHEVQCASCGHTWETIVDFDPSSFFGQGS
jgi:hypothetical protein